jgi:hypothetical protein
MLLQSGSDGQLFLGHFALLPQLADALAESMFEAVGWHARNDQLSANISPYTKRYNG